jgi:hypothetical protein
LIVFRQPDSDGDTAPTTFHVKDLDAVTLETFLAFVYTGEIADRGNKLSN